MDWELIHITEQQGYTVRVFVAPECDIMPDEHLDPEDVEAIRDGQLEWFRVRVIAYKRDIPLGEYYLGGCCYRSARDFLKCRYYTDMCNEAVRDADAALAALKADN